jgi:hypothetical protein
MDEKIKKKCGRCGYFGTNFIDEIDAVCRRCMTKDEVHAYIRPDLTMWMSGLDSFAKQKLMRELVRDLKEERRRELSA